MSEAIKRAVAEATRVSLQTMSGVQAQGTWNVAGSRLSSPTLKQPSFNWEAPDKYTELKTFKLEVNNVLSTSSMPEAKS